MAGLDLQLYFSLFSISPPFSSIQLPLLHLLVHGPPLSLLHIHLLHHPLPIHQNFLFFLTVLSLMLLITHLLSPSSCIHLSSYIHLSSGLTVLPPHPPSPPVPASSPLLLLLQPLPSLLLPLFHFWSRILSSNLRLLTGTEAPLSAPHISQGPQGATHMVVGAGCPCHLNLRPEWSRHLPWASLLEVSVGAEGTALAHLSDSHC